MQVQFRKYTNLPISTQPLIEGRTGSKWLLDNMYRISEEDFYNQSLTEDDLKKKYGEVEK